VVASTQPPRVSGSLACENAKTAESAVVAVVNTPHLSTCLNREEEEQTTTDPHGGVGAETTTPTTATTATAPPGCALCGQPLDYAATANGEGTCTSCEMAQLTGTTITTERTA
jgi:hypothetical protein